MNGAVMTLARYHARQVIKRELYAQGIKLAHIEASEITRKANQYVEDHPEIVAFAMNSTAVLSQADNCDHQGN
jgi:hypothetical protein